MNNNTQTNEEKTKINKDIKLNNVLEDKKQNNQVKNESIFSLSKKQQE